MDLLLIDKKINPNNTNSTPQNKFSSSLFIEKKK